MKKIDILIITFIASLGVLLPSKVNAQNTFRSDDDLMFNHLSVGGSIGLNGIGVDVAMPATAHFTLHAGFSTFSLGELKMKVADEMSTIVSAFNIPQQEILNNAMDKTVEMTIAFNMYTGHLLVDYHPWHTSDFRVTAGMMIGNSNVLHIYNTVDGSMSFINACNKLVDDYNKAFDTNYPYSGLQFGNYILTADEKGNVDAMMKVWVVRPYLGIGWGRDINVNFKRKVNANFDFGFQYWGTPKFDFNNGKKIVSTKSDESGIFHFLSKVNAWPVLKLTLSGEIF